MASFSSPGANSMLWMPIILFLQSFWYRASAAYKLVKISLNCKRKLSTNLLVDRSMLPICCSVEIHLSPLIRMSFVHFQYTYFPTKKQYVFHVSVFVEHLRERFAEGPVSFFDNFNVSH